MGILSKIVKIKIGFKHIEYYKNKGYEIPVKIGKNNKLIFDKDKYIDVKIEDLLPTSKALVEFECDYCGRNFIAQYRSISRNLNINNKCACKNCRIKKKNETTMMLYGYENAMQSEEIKNKIKQTNLLKYGVEWYSQTDSFKEKVIATNLERYGYRFSFEDEAMREKFKQTRIERYGIEYNFQSQETLDKARQTCIEKYGTEYYSQTEEYIDKIKKTNLEKFGCEWSLLNPEVREKIRQTNIERYGVPYSLQNLEIQEKARKTLCENNNCPTSKQQINIYKYLDEEYDNVHLNFIINDKYFGDIVIDNFDIEINYGGHDLCVKLGKLSPEKFKQNEFIRDKTIISKGYKLIKIISYEERKIPSKEKIIEMFELSKEYFNNNAEADCIEFYIEKGFYKDLFNNTDILFDFGDLINAKKEKTA